MERPAAIELALWLNQFRQGNITHTDACNAAETITESLTVLKNGQELGWPAVTEKVAAAATPIYAILPLPGNPYGLSVQTLSEIDPAKGVLALSHNLVLAWTPELKTWNVLTIQMPPVFLELKAARLHLQELIDESTQVLSSLDLHGDRDPIDEELYELRAIYLPPALSERIKTDLERAERIWLICQYGINESIAHGSPSSDALKVQTLNQLKTAALELMAACSSFS
jgi:hypothetical protein